MNVDYEIVDHRVIRTNMPVMYISQECVRTPDGDLVLNEHGQPEMREVQERTSRQKDHFKFTVDIISGKDAGSIIDFMSVPELVNLAGKRKYRNELRAYKQRLKAENEELLTSVETGEEE
jgi:hypothetical protein